MWPRWWVEVWHYSSMTAALEGGEWSAARPGRTLPPGKTRYPFHSKLGGPQGQSGRAEKSRPHRNSIPDRTACSSVTIPTELPAHHNNLYLLFSHYNIGYANAPRCHVCLSVFLLFSLASSVLLPSHYSGLEKAKSMPHKKRMGLC